MRTIRGWAIAGVLVAALQGCIPNAAIKQGDAAAARGDWRAAEEAYGEAVDREPDNVDLAKKYNQARTNAVAFALRTAEACRAGNDAVCAERELAYALELDPSNVQAATLRGEARQQLALRALEEAGAAMQAKNPLAVWQQLDKMRSYGVPPGRDEEIARLDEASASQADESARALLEHSHDQAPSRALATLTQAYELAAGAAARNPLYTGTLAEIDKVRRQVIAVEVEEKTKLGEEALKQENYEAAARAFTSAYQASGDARHQRRASHAEAVQAAKLEIEQRDFEAAAERLRAALDTREDHGAARALLEAVEPRVYRIRLESITITPKHPQTNEPWIGKQWLEKVVPTIAGAAVKFKFGTEAGKLAHDMTDAVVSVPAENRPGLSVFLDLPDGRRLKTQKTKGIYAIYGAEFFLYTNKFDKRTVRLAVYHERSSGDNDSVAVANIPLGQLVSEKIDGAAIQGDAAALHQVVFSADPVDAWQDGAINKLTLQDQAENRASDRSAPTRTTQRTQLVGISLEMRGEAADGDGSTPDPFVELRQGGKRIFRSTTADNTWSASWSPKTTDLFIDPTEELVVKLVDADFSNDDQIATWNVSGKDLLAGTVQLSNPRGTSLVLRTVPRTERPR